MKKKQIKKNLEIETNFWKFVQFLHEQGFIITCEYEDYNKGYSAKIGNDYIKGCIWFYKFERLYSGVAIDNKKCFNKITQCPFRMKFHRRRNLIVIWRDSYFGVLVRVIMPLRSSIIPNSISTEHKYSKTKKLILKKENDI